MQQHPLMDLHIHRNTFLDSKVDVNDKPGPCKSARIYVQGLLIQDTIARLEEDLAAATQRLENAVLNTGESQQALEETQAALRQAQQEGQRTAQEMRGLQGQVCLRKTLLLS